MQDKSGYKFPGYNVLGYGWNVLADTPKHAKKTRLVEGSRAERTTIIGEVSPLYFVMQESKTHYETEIANSLASFEQKRIISTSVAVDNWGFEGEVRTKFGSEVKGSNSVYLANVKRIGTGYLVAF